MRLVRSVPAACALVAAAALTPARAADVQPVGRHCEGVWAQRPDGTYAGEVHGGPYVLAGFDAGTERAAGTLTCTVRTSNWQGAAGAAAVTSAHTGEVVALPTTPVTFVVGQFDQPVVCTSLDVDGRGTLYWDDYDMVWTTAPSGECVGFWGHELTSDYVDDLERHEVDPVACTLLRRYYPPEGDVEGVWNCPPYYP